jgi:wyosine [tRNA(Phe)-imidazoG37] synthetase (radical SAM superfamily)
MAITHITVGLRCNNRCVFCAQRGHDGDVSEAPIVEAGDEVVFAGGEPTLLDDLLERIDAARAAGARAVTLQTNGRRLAYATYVDELDAAGVTALDVSLHGPTPEVHDYHTGVPGSFLQTVKGIRNAVSRDVPTGVTTVVTRSNFRHLPAIAELLKRLGVLAWHLTAATAYGAAASDPTAVTPRLGMIARSLERALTRSALLGIEVVTTGLPPCIARTAVRARRDRTPPRGQRPTPCRECLVADDCAGPAPGMGLRYAEADCSPIVHLPLSLLVRGAGAGAFPFGGIGVVAPNDAT